jgi:hypothetical protein
MERVKKFLPSGMLFAYILKMLCIGDVNFAEMGIVFSLAGMVALNDYIEKHKKLQDMSKVIEKQNIVIKEIAEEVSNLKTVITGVKLQQGVKSVKI